MAGLVPAIHEKLGKEGVDARAKPRHDSLHSLTRDERI
jgi:hypothetical protein